MSRSGWSQSAVRCRWSLPRLRWIAGRWLTVACLLGARWGATAIPAEWRGIIHGYPGIPGVFLATLALDAVAAGLAGS